MAGLRKGKCYTTVKRAYTRKSKLQRKSYVKAAPSVRIIRFDMGDPKKQYDYEVILKSKQAIQLRHNSLESARMVVNRALHTSLGLDYYFKIRVFPHHVLRENKMIVGAGADRMQKGMQMAFGRPVGLAAQVKRNQPVFSVQIHKNNLEIAKRALKKAPPRLAGKFIIEVKKI